MVELVDNEAFNEKIQVILRNTDYNEEVATIKLKTFGYDHVKVIRDYLGVVDKKPLLSSPSIKKYTNNLERNYTSKRQILNRIKRRELQINYHIYYQAPIPNLSCRISFLFF